MDIILRPNKDNSGIEVVVNQVVILTRPFSSETNVVMETIEWAMDQQPDTLAVDKTLVRKNGV